MLSYIQRLRLLTFSGRPDYEFFRSCFERLEETGDTQAFRKKFGGGSRWDAISKEVYGKDVGAAFWNTKTDPLRNNTINPPPPQQQQQQHTSKKRSATAANSEQIIKIRQLPTLNVGKLLFNTCF